MEAEQSSVRKRSPNDGIQDGEDEEDEGVANIVIEQQPAAKKRIVVLQDTLEQVEGIERQIERHQQVRQAIQQQLLELEEEQQTANAQIIELQGLLLRTEDALTLERLKSSEAQQAYALDIEVFKEGAATEIANLKRELQQIQAEFSEVGAYLKRVNQRIVADINAYNQLLSPDNRRAVGIDWLGTLVTDYFEYEEDVQPLLRLLDNATAQEVDTLITEADRILQSNQSTIKEARAEFLQLFTGLGKASQKRPKRRSTTKKRTIQRK